MAMYEEHVRFMILAEHELAGHTGDNFNSHLNLEQINKVLPSPSIASITQHKCTSDPTCSQVILQMEYPMALISV